MFKRFSGYSFFNNHLINYPTPSTLNYLWNFGSLAGIFLSIQIITGLFLSMHYSATTELAFDSVERIARDVNYGWLLKNVHANGASFFFLIIYIHIARALYFQSFKTLPVVWISGIIIFILMMATAFLGYVLPWGQMSFWGATVITNLFSAIPFIGKSIVVWLWGGYSIDSPTLMRFYTLHYCLPFILVGLAVSHILLLHESGSSSTFQKIKFDSIKFSSYYTVKDLLGIIVVLLGFFIMVLFFPNYLGHPDNFIPANPLVTPPHIVPEWYFLPFYAILRAIPNKIGGVFLMFSAIFLLFFIKYNTYLVYNNFSSKITTSRVMESVYQFTTTEFQPLHKIWFWFFVSDFFLLGYLGSQPAKEPFITISLIATFFYFFSLTIGYIITQNLDNYFSYTFFVYYIDTDDVYSTVFFIPKRQHFKKKNFEEGQKK